MKNLKNTTQPYGKRFFGHLKTVHKHRTLVRKYCFKCGLYRQGILHDLSKYSYSEFHPSVKYYQGFRSPYEFEKEIYGYSNGWLHHKGRNKHHFEYWVDLIQGEWTPFPMPYKYLIESVCDRVAACKIYQKEAYTPSSPLNYFLKGCGKDRMHPNTKDQMERILTLISKEGEEVAFKKIKQSIKTHTEL